MSNLRAFKQKLAAVSRLWEEKDYDSALSEVVALLEAWPGNAHLHILWASLVQLQENPRHSLDEAKQAFQQAIDLDRSSPAGPIELGHFLDAVEDNPQAAARAYSEGVAAARHLLIEGLIGQARALLQLDRREEARRCILESLHLMELDPTLKRNRAESPFAQQIHDLLGEVFASRSA
jgi:tetratricopeptide (TPR) repeat protein